MNEYLGLRNWISGIFARPLSVTKRNIWRSTILDKQSPITIDTENLFAVYQSCPYLQSIINKKAEMLSNGCLKLYKVSDNTEVTKHWAIDLMRNPNPLQNYREFTYEYSIYNDVYSNNFVYRNQAFSTSNPRTLWNLPSGQIKIIPTGKWLDQTDLSGIIDRFELWNSEKEVIKKFTTDQVKYVNSGISKNPLVSDSKIISLQLPISNIIGALKTRNMFIYYGPKMLVSAKASDSDASLPLGKDEKKRIEHDFNQVDYGINDVQSHTVVSSASLTASKMSYPTKDLMLFEEIEDDVNAICDAYGMDRDIFSNTKGSTYENKKQGQISTYQSTIKTAGDTYCAFLNQLLNLTDVYFAIDFDDVAVMKENELDEANEDKIEAETLSLLLKDGIITKEQYAERMDVEYTGSDDTQSQEDKIRNAQVQLRGTVGGVEGLVNINTAVSMGQLDRESAINILINVYGFDRTTANGMISQNVQKPTQQ